MVGLMRYTEKSFSVGTYSPNPAKCCQKCVFGKGEHEGWCPERGLEELDDWIFRLITGEI